MFLAKPLIGICILALACTTSSSTNTTVSTDNIPYNFKAPDRVVKLSSNLEEISGITWWDANTLAAVQDEKGIVFFLDATNGSVIRKLKFAGKGDYEDLTKVNSELYVVRSDGDLFRIKKPNKKEVEAPKIENELGAKNDVEGLYFDTAKKQLWLACKESPALDKKKHKGFRAIYAFDLASKKILPEPVLLLNEDSIIHMSHQKYNNKVGTAFKPSAITVKPDNGDIYILSSVGRLLLILDSQQQPKDIIRLSSKYSVQPESITFDPQGGLYIASEGDGGSAKLVYYAPQDNQE